MQLGQPIIHKMGRVFPGIETLGGLLIVHRKRCPRNRFHQFCKESDETIYKTIYRLYYVYSIESI